MGVVAVGCGVWIARSLQYKLSLLDRKRQTADALAILLSCSAYIGLQLRDWASCGLSPSQNAYTSLFFVITATSMFAASPVEAFSAFAAVRLISDFHIPQQSIQLHFEIISLLSVLLMGIAVVTFATVYLTPIVF